MGSGGSWSCRELICKSFSLLDCEFDIQRLLVEWVEEKNCF